jgi:hypothetical protein
MQLTISIWRCQTYGTTLTQTRQGDQKIYSMHHEGGNETISQHDAYNFMDHKSVYFQQNIVIEVPIQINI